VTAGSGGRGGRRGARAAIATLGVAVLAVGIDAHGVVSRWLETRALTAAIDRLPVAYVEPDLLARTDRRVTRILVVGDDRRAGPRPRRRMTGSRADSVSVWSVSARGVTILSLPRDLRVHVHDYGDGKLDGVLEYGPSAMVRAVQTITGLPVDHYVDLRFAAFRRVIHVLDGVDLVLRNAVWDDTVGLNLPAGHVHLDAATALRYVRSRHIFERIDGKWVADPGDLGRIVRQQRLLGAVVAAVRSRPVRWVAAHASALLDGGGITSDQRFDAAVLRDLLRILETRTDDVTACTLPTRLQVPAAYAMSPFAPPHDGSTILRVPALGSTGMLAWISAAKLRSPAPAGCRPIDAQVPGGAS
jgi:LCP family protein required for cell wall assembly